MVTKNARQWLYSTGGITVETKELTEIKDGSTIRLINQHDYLEFLNYSISHLIKAISDLSESVDTLRKDIRLIRVGDEEYVFGNEIEDNKDIDLEDVPEREGD